MGQPEFIYGLRKLSARHRGCVATIGSFDGVHRGHRALLEQLTSRARDMALPSLVMVFEPQPNEYFARDRSPARLMRLREKVCTLFDAGVDRVLCLKFDESLRSLTAQAYIDRVLVTGIGVRYLIIGDDFRFGCDRSGDYAMLCRAGERFGFGVSDTETEFLDSERISSTRVRAMLEAGELREASSLLGRDYSISGRVSYGKQLGRELGYPTLNIGLGRYRSPLHGVFAVQVTPAGSAGGHSWPGVANIGMRPTIADRSKALLEVHIFDQNLELYGKLLTVSFKKQLRDEKKFPNIERLREQIARDYAEARKYFGLPSDNK